MGTDQPPRRSSTPNTMHRGQHGGSTPINNMEVALRPSTAKKSLNCETIFYFISACLVKVKHISIIHYCSTVNHHQQIPGHTHGQSSIPLCIVFLLKYFILKTNHYVIIARQLIVISRFLVISKASLSIRLVFFKFIL
jgi:hypothetical protein